MLANKTTMGLLALYFGIVVGYEYTRIYADEDELNMSPVNGALLAMFALFMTVPQLVFQNGEMSLVNQNNEDSTIIHGWEMVEDGISRLGSSGIFQQLLWLY